jgi:hypothetical protein
METQLEAQTGRGGAQGEVIGDALRLDVSPGHPEGEQKRQQQGRIISQPDVQTSKCHAQTSIRGRAALGPGLFLFRFSFLVFRYWL